jgi:hypothetical protein
MKTKDRRFYHYTKSLDTLCHYILKDGFWPQYSLEDFSWVQDGKPLYLAFPCVCFTELPLEQSQMHRDDYGNYVIGFGSGWQNAQRLKPLKYVTDQDKVTPLLKPHHCRALTKCYGVDTSDGLIRFPPTKLRPKDFDGVWHILPYLKEKLGHTLQRLPKPRGDRSHVWLTKYLKDELEWRYIPENHREALFSVVDYDTKTMDMLGRLSLATHDSHLGFTHADVSIIIVVTDAERQELAAMFPQLDGKIRIWDEFSKPREDC